MNYEKKIFTNFNNHRAKRIYICSPASPKKSQLSSPESTNSETTTAEPTTEENTEKDTTEEEKPVATATSEESTKEQTKTTTATKKDEQAKPKSATGTYNGFADTSSVEIEMSDGSYQTFMVNDEDLVNKLNDMDEGTKITFTYGAVEGQANMERFFLLNNLNHIL